MESLFSMECLDSKSGTCFLDYSHEDYRLMLNIIFIVCSNLFVEIKKTYCESNYFEQVLNKFDNILLFLFLVLLLL